METYTITTRLLSDSDKRLFETAIDECLNEAHAIYLPIQYVSEFFISIEHGHWWGRCFDYDDHFRIEINRTLFEHHAPKKALKEIILHELCHTIANADSHTGVWKNAVKQLNSCYGYQIKGYCYPEDLGLSPDLYFQDYRYKLVCEDCGTRYDRMRKSNLVKHPERYQCAECGGNIHLENTMEVAS